MRKHIRKSADRPASDFNRETTAACGAILWNVSSTPEGSDCQRCRTIHGLPKTVRVIKVPQDLDWTKLVVLGINAEVRVKGTWEPMNPWGHVPLVNYSSRDRVMAHRNKNCAGYHLVVVDAGLCNTMFRAGFLRSKRDAFKDIERRFAEGCPPQPRTRYERLMGVDLL